MIVIMKKKYIILSALSMFSLFSCQDFLQEESKSQMTLDYYYTDKGLNEGVAAVYSSCREMFRGDMFEINYFSDLSEVAASQNNSYDHVGKVSAGFLNNLFCNMHQGIMIANRMERIIGDNPETRTKEIYLAELRGLRAMFYQIQAELWGKYGHYQETVYDQFEESMLYLNQKPLSFYYEQILKDIDYAIEKLPTQSEIKEFGRLSQGAAKALKARFLLAIAGYSNPEYAGQEEHNMCTQLGFASENDLYTQVRALARSVINDYSYALLPSYGDNFDESYQINKEVIWSVQWTTDKTFNTDEAGYHRFGIGRTCETLDLKEKSTNNFTATMRSLAVTRLDESGSKFTFSMPCHSMYYGREYRHIMPSFAWINMFDNKDKRKAETFETLYLRIDDDKAAPSDMTDTVAYMPFRAITLEEDEWHRKWVESGDPHAYYLDGMNEVYDMDDPNDTRHYGGPLLHRSRYYSLKKFYDRSRTEKGKQDEGTANGTVIRLAEMFLIDAECAFRLKEGEQVVYNALKPLWERAFDNLEDANVYKPKNGMDIHFIVDEYSRELGMEFNTFFILKRTRTLLERIGRLPISKEEENSGILRYADYVKEYGEYLYIKPFPESQATRFKVMSRELLPPGYDYGSLF